jgi:hypothetical protein
MATHRVLAALAVATLVGACNRGPTPAEVRAERFRPLYRTARNLDAALGSGVTYIKFGELLQELTAEVMVAGDVAKEESDQALVSAYTDLLTTYKDSAVVWKQKLESDKLDFHKGRILVIEEVAPLIEKYKLPAKDNAIGDIKYRTLDPEAIQHVWAAAGEKSKKAREMYLQPPAKAK